MSHSLQHPITVAIAGNPNSGKTTLFNALTGANAKIGNYPGITVDRRTGSMSLPKAGEIELIDVPGTYSLTARSIDEEVAIIDLLGRKGLKRPDAAIIVLDATSLERNLFLLMQVMEFEVPVIGAVNMMDSAKNDHIEIHFDKLEEIFKTPFVGVTARKREGMDALRHTLDDLLVNPKKYQKPRWLWKPCPELEQNLQSFDKLLQEEVGFLGTRNRRRAFSLWLLMSLSEDVDLRIRPKLRQKALQTLRKIRKAGRDLDKEVILTRYEFIDGNAPSFIKRPSIEDRSTTDKIDAVLTHPAWGSIIFILIMGIIFQALFAWSEPFISLIERGFEALSSAIQLMLPQSIIRNFLTEGLIAGVGGIIVFLPQILFLFLFISLLEGSGYLSRAAFLIDRIMRKIGLHGQAFVPMLSGLACAVPAIMATRTIENKRDRMLTLMVIPLMSCSARLPVYTLIIAILFPAEQKLGFISIGTLILLGIYVLSTILALVAASVLGKIIFKGTPRPLLLELPPYRMPDLKSVGMTILEQGKVFLSTAGSVILVMTIILWLLLSFPVNNEMIKTYDMRVEQARGDQALIAEITREKHAERLQNSYAGRLGTFTEPLIEPLGFDWKISIGLIGAFAAREVFVSTMGVVYGIGEDAHAESLSLRAAMQNARRPDGRKLWTPLTGMSLMVFFMISMQCMSTLAVTRRETKSWKWTIFMAAYLTVSAYIASLIVYQGGQILGFG